MSDMKKCSAYSVPSTGGTVTVPSFDGTVFTQFVNPVGLLATLNIVLPAAIDGQIVRVVSSQTLTLVGLSSVVGSILGAVTTLLGNSSFSYIWSDDASKWFKVS